MASKARQRRHRERTCDGRERFRSFDQADRVADALISTGQIDSPAELIRCKHCKGWHISEWSAPPKV